MPIAERELLDATSQDSQHNLPCGLALQSMLARFWFVLFFRKEDTEPRLSKAARKLWLTKIASTPYLAFEDMTTLFLSPVCFQPSSKIASTRDVPDPYLWAGQ